MGMGMRRWLVFALAFASFDCRCRTEYKPAVTNLCNLEAADIIEARRADGGHVDPLDYKNLCEACCSKHGLTGVDPGPCECGNLGLDVLMK